MTMVLMLLLLTLMQFVAGFGLLAWCKISLRPALLLPLSILTGVAVFSVVPFLLQLLFIPITSWSVFGTLGLVCLLLKLPLRRSLSIYKKTFNDTRFTIRMYELPFLLIIGVIVFASVWRCFYFPPTPRDLTSGAEAIAEYAVREKTMINSVFTVNMESTNNPFKPLFVTSLQVIYKLAGFHFGQLWLSTIFISFIFFLYQLLNQTLHRIVSGILLVAFIAIPEMFAYSFMVLFDYANAVYFFIGVYFLISWFNDRQNNKLFFAGLLMGIATYTRNETIILTALLLPAIIADGIKRKVALATILKRIAILLAPSIICYIICVTLYLNHYLPVKYDVPGLINTHLTNLSPLVQRINDINTKLIFSASGINYYAYFFFLFLTLLIAELAVKRALNITAANWLYAVLVVYIGLALIGFLLPLADLENTTKRGLFKIFPLMLLYMANNKLLMGLSQRITSWERPAAHAG